MGPCAMTATAAHFRSARIFTDILDRICLLHDRRSFVPLAHKCREEGEELNCTSTAADSTEASRERDNRQTAGEGHRNSSVGVVSRVWTQWHPENRTIDRLQGKDTGIA